MRLGLDMDGCMYDWEGTARFLLKQHFSYNLPESTYWRAIPDSIEKKHWNWLWDSGVGKHGLFRHGDCYKGCFDALQKLAAGDHDLVIITSRPKQARKDTLDWLAFHQIEAKEVHILGPNNGGKSQISCDVYVDDSLENVAELRSAGKKVFLMDRPWNRGANEFDSLRLSSWEDFLMIVNEMEEKGK